MYENYFPEINAEYIGLPVVSIKDTATIHINYPYFGEGWTFYGDNLRAGYFTGRWGKSDGKVILQILIEFSEHQYGWVYAEDYKFGNKSSNVNLSSLESLLNQILSNNQKIVENNLVAARMITLIEAKGKSVSPDIKNGIRDLQIRVNERDAKLAANEWLTGRKTAKPAGASNYAADLSKLMGANIGVVLTLSVTTVIVLSAIVTAIIGTLLYYAFADSGKMSLNDFKSSKKYLEVLSRMSPEDKKVVEKEMTKALNYGYKVGGATKMKNFGLMAAGVGIFFLAKPVGERLGLTPKN